MKVTRGCWYEIKEKLNEKESHLPSAMSRSKVILKYCKCAAKYWQLELNDRRDAENMKKSNL